MTCCRRGDPRGKFAAQTLSSMFRKKTPETQQSIAGASHFTERAFRSELHGQRFNPAANRGG